MHGSQRSRTGVGLGTLVADHMRPTLVDPEAAACAHGPRIRRAVRRARTERATLSERCAYRAAAEAPFDM
jgi:hypothetical protein